jgi:phospholipase/carboxylesterase
MNVDKSPITDLSEYKKGQLSARPTKIAKKEERSGLMQLEFGKKQEALLFVPKKYKAENPAPLALMHHGAGGNAHHGINIIEAFAEEAGIIILATKSRNATWDVIADRYGADVEFIDLSLKHVFERYAIDKTRLAVGGFSDGASYALSLGIINGELFSHILAFSPGFMAPTVQAGSPKIFISHGTNDRVLPIDNCSRKLVPQLKRAGYELIYKEFNGPHTIPPEIGEEAVEWFTRNT